MPDEPKRKRGRPPGVKRKHKVYTYLSDEEQEEFEWLQEQRRGSMAAVLREAVMELARRIREGGKS